MKTIILNLLFIGYCLFLISKPTIEAWFPLTIYMQRPYTAIGIAFIIVGVILIYNELWDEAFVYGAEEAVRGLRELMEHQNRNI